MAAKDVSVLVVGPTGYIGRFVVKELISRGYNVVVFAREKSGVGGKTSKEQTIKASTALGGPPSGHQMLNAASQILQCSCGSQSLEGNLNHLTASKAFKVSCPGFLL